MKYIFINKILILNYYSYSRFKKKSTKIMKIEFELLDFSKITLPISVKNYNRLQFH